jgi:multiple sugar transport system substrate-binding protein
VRKLLAALVGLWLVPLACANGEPAADSEEVGGTIRLQASGEAEETAVYDTLVKAFEDANPSIRVTLAKVAEKEDHLARLTTSFAAGRSPDIFLVNFREYTQFVSRGGVEPFGNHIDDAGVSLDDYFPQPIEAFTYNDELQCMPQNISSLVVYYNRELFKRAGVPEPRGEWTWEEFRRTALDLTDGQVHGLGISPEIIRVAPFVWSNGGDIVDDADSPTRFTLETPKAREALEFIVSLVREDRVIPSEEDVAAQDLETRFATGKLGMLLSSRRDTPVFREVLGLDWDVAPLPTAEEPAGILHSDAYCISSQSDNVEVAVRFISFAIGREGQTITALAGRTVPSLREVANSQAFLDPTRPPAHSRVFLSGIPYIQRTPVLPTWPEIEAIAEEILTRAFYENDYTIDDAIADLREQTDPLFEEGAE